jgi:hypothetical protein
MKRSIFLSIIFSFFFFLAFSQEVKFYAEVPSYRIEIDSSSNEYLINKQYRKIQVMENVKTPGTELGLYYKHHTKGLIMVCSGGLISAASFGIMNNNLKSKNVLPKTGIVMGVALSLAGFGFMLEAPVHIKRASILLNANGVGIKYGL